MFLYILISVCLIGNYFLYNMIGVFDSIFWLGMILVVCLFVFFGGVFFLCLLGWLVKLNVCFVVNLFGVIFGGLLENFCVIGGMKSLSFLVLVLYLFLVLLLML